MQRPEPAIEKTRPLHISQRQHNDALTPGLGQKLKRTDTTLI